MENEKQIPYKQKRSKKKMTRKIRVILNKKAIRAILLPIARCKLMPRGLKKRIRRLLKRQRKHKKISRKSKRFLRRMNYLILNPPAIIVHHHKKCHHKHHRHGQHSPQKSENSLKKIFDIIYTKI